MSETRYNGTQVGLGCGRIRIRHLLQTRLKKKKKKKKKNIGADCMSRYPSEKNETDSNKGCVKIDDKTVKTICFSITPPSLIETLPAFNINVVDATDTRTITCSKRS